MDSMYLSKMERKLNMLANQVKIGDDFKLKLLSVLEINSARGIFPTPPLNLLDLDVPHVAYFEAKFLNKIGYIL